MGSTINLIGDYKYDQKEPTNPSYYRFDTFDSIEFSYHLCNLFSGADAFYVGNINKYLMRAPLKNKVLDIQKTITYVQWVDPYIHYEMQTNVYEISKKYLIHTLESATKEIQSRYDINSREFIFRIYSTLVFNVDKGKLVFLTKQLEESMTEYYNSNEGLTAH